jgi:hypothetical protein
MSTSFVDRIYDNVDFDRDLVFKFFTIFSLFEFALKQALFVRSTRRVEVQPDWDRFAREIDGHYDPNESSELSYAIKYFLDRPPMKQVLEGDRVVFCCREPDPSLSDTEKLAIYIRRVRNNLFHGGKFRYIRPRDPVLIEYSLVILDAWARCHSRVHAILMVFLEPD